MNPRLLAVCDLMVPSARENAGLHVYDGQPQDLSEAGVKAGLSRLGGAPLPNSHDEEHLRAFEHAVRVIYGELQMHRRNPRMIIDNLDISVYAHLYAPEEERAEARRRHLAAWPDAIDAALSSLDAVAAPTAAALLPSARGLLAPLVPDHPDEARALPAHRRLVAHLEEAAKQGDPDPGFGAEGLERLLGATEAVTVRLEDLRAQAEGELQRLDDMLTEACGRIGPGLPVAEVMRQLTSDHPDADGVLDTARDLTDEVLDFTVERGLVDGQLDGIIHVAPSPPSRRWATAMLSWAAPFEADGPSWYLITPPDPEWSATRRDGWLAAFNYAGLPSTTAHEVAPGHFTHSRFLRRAPGEVRKALHSPAFVEGWAHYAEELLVEEGFRGGNPRYAAGVATKALLRVVRLIVSIGVHSRTMSLEEAATLFEERAYLREPAAWAETNRATFDPTYGRYTWGKLVVLALREQARQRWGSRFGLAHFHRELLRLGAPPLGLVGAVLDAPPPR